MIKILDVYFYIMLYELILYTKGKKFKALISLEIVFFIAVILFRFSRMKGADSLVFWRRSMLDISMVFLGLFFYCLSLFMYRTLIQEKRKVEQLNKELELSYNKLKEQSEKLEELAITKERNRVAGEIHDNLGHSLVALNMHLDVIEKILETDNNKATSLIRKSQNLTQESMDDLRRAVYALKESKPERLINSIKKIIDDIEATGNVKISLKVDGKTETILPKYKEIIYTSTKEAITNSIKHGKADEIDIYININEEDMNITIDDNGSGCKNLIKGNGLSNIEERIRELGGMINYDIQNRVGFAIELTLPLVNKGNFIN